MKGVVLVDLPVCWRCWVRVKDLWFDANNQRGAVVFWANNTRCLLSCFWFNVGGSDYRGDWVWIIVCLSGTCIRFPPASLSTHWAFIIYLCTNSEKNKSVITCSPYRYLVWRVLYSPFAIFHSNFIWMTGDNRCLDLQNNGENATQQSPFKYSENTTK